MPAMRRLVIDLDSGEYRRLRERAQAEDRDAHLEARHIVRQALRAPSPPVLLAQPGEGDQEEAGR